MLAPLHAMNLQPQAPVAVCSMQCIQALRVAIGIDHHQQGSERDADQHHHIGYTRIISPPATPFSSGRVANTAAASPLGAIIEVMAASRRL